MKTSLITTKSPFTAYTDHPLAILIDGNVDFSNQASSNSWDGDGSIGTPYSITGLNITNSSLVPLIAISNTDVYFNITSNFISGGSYGILLDNVTNGLIWDNSISSAANSGIGLSQSEYIWVDRNEIYENLEHGVYLSNTNDSTIFNATLRNNGQSGVVADYTIDIEIEECEIHANGEDGVKIREGHHNQVLENHIYNNGASFYGITFGNSDHNIVSENYIYENSHGINNGDSHYNNFTHNAIYNNTGIGIVVADHSLIEDNIFYNNDDWGVRAWGTNTTVTQNNFIDNNLPLGGSSVQAADQFNSNTFTHNFWSDWSIPDANDDNIVDVPYTSDTLTDNYPLIEVVVNPMLHLLTRPIITYPNDEFYVQGDVNITWGMASDTYGHEVLYSLDYSLNNGSTWMFIDDDISDLNYIWDSTEISTNQYTLIRVSANCTTELTSFDVSDEIFAIANNEHTLSTPTFISPTAGERVGGILLLEWEEAIDSWYLPVTYALYYLSMSDEWELIDENIESPSYAWDTTTESEGEMTLMVVAKSLEVLESNSTSGVFIIDNEPDPPKIPGFHVSLILGFGFISICALVVIFKRKR